MFKKVCITFLAMTSKCFSKLCMYMRRQLIYLHCVYSVKTIVMSGKAPVDVECPLQGKAHVHKGSDISDCMFHQVRATYQGFYT